jgi:hypothetical protein
MKAFKFILVFALCVTLNSGSRAHAHEEDPQVEKSADNASPVEAPPPQRSPESIALSDQDYTSDSDGEEEAETEAEAEVEPIALPINFGELFIYGYFSVRLEKPFGEPALGNNGQTVYEDGPAEWSLPFFHVMLQHRLSDDFKAFVNISGAGGQQLDLRNMWGEYTARDYFNLRIGKTYRKFGLYNEILDAVPTYIGIEPPELFDADHLIVSRTTILMSHGRTFTGPGNMNYSLTTDNGEGDPVAGTIPLGWDYHYKLGGAYTLGTSGYWSNGPTTPDRGVGEGPPRSGVLPWMEFDQFNVYGAYFEARPGALLFQAAYWQSPHDALRDAGSVVTVVNSTELNERQLANFLKDPTGPVVEENVRVNASYNVQTWYLRSGYSFDTRIGEIVPYFLWDWYKNPETIADKRYGGDNEAGVADDGQFHKSTLGVVFRPISQVAIKLDTSTHYYKFNHESVSYPEFRFDVSFIFGQ